jgi:hypothetical protein
MQKIVVFLIYPKFLPRVTFGPPLGGKVQYPDFPAIIDFRTADNRIVTGGQWFIINVVSRSLAA